MAKPDDMYQCQTVDYVYDLNRGNKKDIASPGTSFNDLSNERHCLSCGVAEQS